MYIKQIFLIIMFALSIIGIIKEPIIRLGKRKFIFDYGTAPLISVGILGIFGYLSFDVINKSLLGSDGILPWQVILIFFTGAFICITLDSTGVFEYVSFKIINFVKGDSKKLFFGIAGLTAFLTIFSSNDIVILTMTPIVCYMAKHSKINPFPYLIVVFFSANAWSMLFYVGNPPNIIVAQALNLSFIEYAKLMFFPTLAAGISTMICSYFLFRKQINQKINLVDKINPDDYLRNKKLSIIEVSIFIILFILLLIGEYIGLRVWQIMLIFFIIYFLISLISSFHFQKIKYFSNKYHYEKTKQSLFARNINFDITELKMNFARVPWKILPLIVSLFVLIQLFNVYLITDILAKALNYLNTDFLASILMPLISATSANIMINQPMTIFFANAFTNANYFVEGSARLANGLGLIIGTNLGGNLTLFGALAGLMWRKILSYNGIYMSYKLFLHFSLKITLLVIFITSIVLFIQMRFL